MRGQWLESEGVRWWFDAGSLALDFASARPFIVAADVGEWLAERFDRISARDAEPRDLVDALALRAAIERMAGATADRAPLLPADVDVVNLYAATPDVPPALGGGRRQAGAGRLRIAQGLASVARDAVHVLSTEPERIRRCEAHDCARVFRDDSRTANRRWCSMQRCGNRAKVRAHRARRMAGVPTLFPMDQAG